MPETLNEVLDQAAKDGIKLSDDAARDAAIAALKTHYNPVYLAINNLGFGAAQAKHTQEITDAKAALSAAEGRASQAELALKAAIDKAPDVAAVNGQWETKFSDLRDEHKKALAKAQATVRNSFLSRDREAIAGLMHEKHNVPLAMARVMVKDPDLDPRMQYDDHGALSVLQAGLQIPYVPGSGETAHSLMAAELASSVDDNLKVSNGDSGSGVNGGSRPGKGDAAFFENIRQSATKAQEGLTQRKSLQERIASRQ